jgi:predicted metal-dependent hydrolase
MQTQVQLGDLAVDVIKKDIKNVHLSVHPPTGRIRISAPHRLNLDTIRVFAISKLGWIKQQKQKLQEQERETPREFLDRESHYLWGRRFLLKIIEADHKPAVELDHSRMILRVRQSADHGKKGAIIEEWYRDQVKKAAPELIAKWEALLGVKVQRLYVQRMKTKWGSCNHRAHAIRLNTDLAKKPRECLEYILVHEMIHLLEPTHNARFISLMNQALPKWQFHRQILNSLPVRHETWGY